MHHWFAQACTHFLLLCLCSQDFSVRIANRDLPQLVNILRGISLKDQAALRLGMAKHYRAFVW